MTTEFKQRRKVGVAGELMNQLMGNNSTRPEVGKGATELMYSDRHPYQVVAISEDGKRVTLEAYDATGDRSKGELQMGHQNWLLNPTGRKFDIVWRSYKNGGKWYRVYTQVVFTTAFISSSKENGFEWPTLALTKEQHALVYDANMERRVVDGITREAIKYSPISIIFGRMEYHHDWSF